MQTPEYVANVRKTVEDAAEAAVARIEGIGTEQYVGEDGHRFVKMPLDKLFEYIDEEIVDLVAYLPMIRIKKDHLKELLDPVFPDDWQPTLRMGSATLELFRDHDRSVFLQIVPDDGDVYVTVKMSHEVALSIVKLVAFWAQTPWK